MPSLTRDEAATRGALLSVASYHVDLDLTGSQRFRSTTVIEFDAVTAGTSTFVEIKTDLLRSATLNGRSLPVADLSDGRLPLTGLASTNRLEVVAESDFSREGEGLHRYVDPGDGQVYVYGFVYVDNAPKVFACFDQPDLKAPFVFTLLVPDDWQVLGSGTATRLSTGRWRVVGPGPQPTYLTTIVAGPYRSILREHNGITLGVHARASLASALAAEADEIVEVTRQCLDGYRDLFGVEYPFERLDQVFAPEFSVLSLDHPGCVLLREQYLFQSAATDSERETRAVVLAHGISLMWLAGLVTHRWWDDLWLGQAFADYAAHRITSEVTRFPGPPTTFAVRRKAQAYIADQRPSTHPVSLEGPDVRTVLLEMDRISYFKGHSVLRQLAVAIGPEGLTAGLRAYFGAHAQGTATFDDFLAALQPHTGLDLKSWADIWLRRAGTNTLRSHLTVADGMITDAVIGQSAPVEHPVLRPHTLNIGLYGGVPQTIRVHVEGERTRIPELIGRPVPDLLLLNDGDLTYAKIGLDPGSLAALPRLLPTLSPLNRAMVWCNLLLAVQDGGFSAEAHLNLVTAMVGYEDEPAILAEVLEQARYDVADRFLDPRRRSVVMARVGHALRQRTAVLPTGNELQITLFRSLIDFCFDVGYLDRCLAGLERPGGLSLDEDLRWRLRHRLAVLGGYDQAQIERAVQDRPGAVADRWAATCQAALPQAAAKAAAWESIMAGGSSSYDLWALAEGFWQPEQAELTWPYERQFFARIPEAADHHGDLVVDLLLRHLYPRHAASAETLVQAEALLARPDLSPTLRYRIADHTDDLRRVVAVRVGEPGVNPDDRSERETR